MEKSNETRARVATLLKHYREAAGLTIREAGDKIGKSNQTVSAWEQGRGQPDAEMFLKLCDVYGVESVSVFFGESKNDTDGLSDDERDLLELWRNATVDGKKSALAVLQVNQQPETVRIFRAARSEDGSEAPQVVEVPKSRIDKLRDAKEADEI